MLHAELPAEGVQKCSAAICGGAKPCPRPLQRSPVPRTLNIQVVNDLCSKVQHRRARQLYLARELAVLDAAESFVEA